jgi:hypothetical protein
MYQLTLNENIIRGDTWDGIEFTINKPSIDYTGATIRVHVRRQVDSAILIEKSIAPTTAINGQVVFTFALTNTETALLNSNGVADIEITANGKVETSILIQFTVTKDVTK